MSLVTGLFFPVLLLNQRWSPPLRLQASHYSTSRIVCDVSSIIIIIIIIIIGIQPLGRFGQRPELSQAIGMVLVRCILGKSLGVACHCFPPRSDVLTFATRCLHVPSYIRGPEKQSLTVINTDAV